MVRQMKTADWATARSVLNITLAQPNCIWSDKYVVDFCILLNRLKIFKPFITEAGFISYLETMRNHYER